MDRFTLKAKVFYNDATDSGDLTPIDQITDLEQGSIIRFPVGFNAIGLDQENPEKTPTHYQVWLVNGNDVVKSEIRTYHLRSAHYNELDFWFQTSLGAVEAVAFHSGHTIGASISKEEFAQEIPFTTSLESHQMQSTPAVIGSVYKASTGYVSLPQLKYLVDFFASQKVWWISGGYRIPVVIKASSLELVKEAKVKGEHEYAINFEYKRAHINSAISNINAQF